ncbi:MULTISPECIES: potassium-transporting ATPase subunit KdpC [Faecalicoccus]|uniref:Potassium-transporting ATPase KdpC subunit n=1 Tax=Faecalicoccus pleomorphus TaxID=1323 RepID=A0AAW6CW01_9FIRM|nr:MULTISPECIES: potassium-transporting ATPase subunit KdpC [Faecalicoccus]MDB7981147.1 potassium-transporting ATPase subunit KdpC [Faecalicoccus pleomorphus]MDB7982280.1 potassium-transporting ATPase subunit KdpC [Faecalicoccus pleomorphus]MDB7985506.1 potassium-transporting ATPase subunit KdpC [Faecalicoccus pleomorphus]
MRKYLKPFKTAFFVSIAMFLLCGFAYPMVLTGISQVIFPNQANGSLVEMDGKAVGSTLVGQDFTDERLFHCRPSAYNYNTYTQEDKGNGTYTGLSSGSNNYAVSNPKLEERLNQDIEQFLKENPTITRDEIPSDIITASGSGLDPHISVEAANVQVDRIVKNTQLSETKVKELIKQNTAGKLFGIFGEERVNVLELNLSLVKELKN